jgi:hypothetical protein
MEKNVKVNLNEKNTKEITEGGPTRFGLIYE